MRKKLSGPGQGTSSALKTTDVHRASPLGDHYDKARQGRPAKLWRDDLDTCWMDAIWQRTAQDSQIGDGMLRPSPNHGTLRLPNDDGDYKAILDM